MAKVKILGVLVDDVNSKEALGRINAYVEGQGKHYVVTPNPEQVMFAQKNPKFKSVLNKADLSICDGTGLLLASKFLGVSVRERICGSDLMLNLCGEAANKGWKVGLLGGKGKTASCAKASLIKQYKGLKVPFAKEGNPSYVFDKSIRAEIPKLDLLFVAYGAPKQEEWIARNLREINVKVAIPVGGAFDFITGKQKRAPKFIQKIALEWLWRLVLQPWRIKRQLSLPHFAFRVLMEKLI